MYAIFARNNGQSKIPVYIFPFEMTAENMTKYKTNYKNETALLNFWKTLKVGFDTFEKDKQELNVTVDAAGNYGF